jgi:hypothetical protein
MNIPMYADLSSRCAADTGHVLRTVRSCGPYAVHRLAAEERYEAAAAATARARSLRESGVGTTGFGSRIAEFRTLVGSTLIRVGERLRAQPTGNSATRTLRGT